MPWAPHQHASGRWVLNPEPCACADIDLTAERQLVLRSLDARLPIPFAKDEEAMVCFTRFVLRLPDEMKQLVFDHLAAGQDQKYGHVERPQHIHFYAADMLKPLPPIHTVERTLDPWLDWIDFAEEAIAKNAIVHLTTDFSSPLSTSLQTYAQQVRHLSLTMKSNGGLLSFRIFDMESIESSLPFIKTQFANLQSLDVLISNSWTEIWLRHYGWAGTIGKANRERGISKTGTTRRILEIMECIEVKKMLCVHDVDDKTWVWHG